MIPTNFEDWKYCIESYCGISLSREFVKERIAVYENTSDAETKKFISLYGETHRQNILSFYKRLI